MKKIILLFVFLFFITGFGQVRPLVTTTTIAVQIVDPPPPVPNVIAFDYDVAGNQIKRKYIYVTSGIYRTANPVTAQPKTEELQESDLFKDIKYYPNPVQSELYVQWSNNVTNVVESMELYNMTGQLMRRFENLKSEENTIINFESFPSGYYILNLTYTNGEVKDLRIIKK